MGKGGREDGCLSGVEWPRRRWMSVGMVISDKYSSKSL